MRYNAKIGFVAKLKPTLYY